MKIKLKSVTVDKELKFEDMEVGDTWLDKDGDLILKTASKNLPYINLNHGTVYSKILNANSVIRVVKGSFVEDE
jgi:hypothetical protein